MPDQDTTTTTARASEQEGDVHRLRDIVVEEVSLVDRAANKRRFLVVKRSDAMHGESDENGVEKAKKKPASEDEPIDEAKAKKSPQDEEPEDAAADADPAVCQPPDADAKAKPKRKADVALPADLKESLLSTLTEAMERLMALAQQIKDASEPDGEADNAALPDDLGAEIEAIAELLGEATAKRKKKTSKAEAAGTEVAKGGSRMAKDRLDRFQKAMALLSDILKEITRTNEDPPAPTAGAAEASVQKREPALGPSEVPGLKELVAGITALTSVMKRQEEELGRVRQARGTSNVIPVDGGARRAEPQDVSWPLDMNRPISRDKVRKEVSFFDE